MPCQYGVVLYIFSGGKSADRIENLTTGAQFAIEGTQTLMLLRISKRT